MKTMKTMKIPDKTTEKTDKTYNWIKKIYTTNSQTGNIDWFNIPISEMTQKRATSPVKSSSR